MPNSATAKAARATSLIRIIFASLHPMGVNPRRPIDLLDFSFAGLGDGS
jgi:hypothetical protein